MFATMKKEGILKACHEQYHRMFLTKLLRLVEPTLIAPLYCSLKLNYWIYKCKQDDTDMQEPSIPANQSTRTSGKTLRLYPYIVFGSADKKITCGDFRSPNVISEKCLFLNLTKSTMFSYGQEGTDKAKNWVDTVEFASKVKIKLIQIVQTFQLFMLCYVYRDVDMWNVA